MDTLDVRPVPGVVLKLRLCRESRTESGHFTARDVVSRWYGVEAQTWATATTARVFLDTLQARLPFPLKATQSLP